MSTRIAAAAIRISDGTIWSLPPPARHGDILRYLWEETHQELFVGAVQGFVDEHRQFLTRKEAMDIAKYNGQLKRVIDEKKYQGPELYSEDLW